VKCRSSKKDSTQENFRNNSIIKNLPKLANLVILNNIERFPNENTSEGNINKNEINSAISKMKRIIKSKIVNNNLSKAEEEIEISNNIIYQYTKSKNCNNIYRSLLKIFNFKNQNKTKFKNNKIGTLLELLEEDLKYQI